MIIFIVMLKLKYAFTAWIYDILDYPWERLYRQWRTQILADVHGKVLEAGVGTGRNLPYYADDVELLGIDLSPTMLMFAKRRARQAACQVELRQEDASQMPTVASATYDWVLSTFMCCVMPDYLQQQTIAQFQRVLKPGGKFKLLEMVYSQDPTLRRRQARIAPLVELIYGARFDRHTLERLQQADNLEVSRTEFLKDDVYLLIEGKRRD